MPIITGRDCDLSIGSQLYADVVNTFELVYTAEAVEYQTLGGPIAGPGAETGTLNITFAYDSGETPSLFDDLWTAVEAGTPVAYVATVGKSKFTGNAIAVRPGANATAGEVSEVVIELPLDGMPSKAAVTP